VVSAVAGIVFTADMTRRRRGPILAVLFLQSRLYNIVVGRIRVYPATSSRSTLSMLRGTGFALCARLAVQRWPFSPNVNNMFSGYVLPPEQRAFTMTTLQRKSHLCIPFLGIARLQSQFPHSCVCERFYVPRIGPHIFLQQNSQTDPGNI
jgi:hypothetical protein